ncbi:hypothetical protein FA95DRAFT_1330489 [Auriscalpium vulgare]|uniref:Uncharacterized protein n=1 Tax=Auriscalpium vulgare TaxID=40419 RepID=A0ACB8S9D3_9AGAM|nr:hypothetical protein FA95DRAFT_1330489 [Auriscalpium vulgare]
MPSHHRTQEAVILQSILDDAPRLRQFSPSIQYGGATCVLHPRSIRLPEPTPLASSLRAIGIGPHIASYLSELYIRTAHCLKSHSEPQFTRSAAALISTPGQALEDLLQHFEVTFVLRYNRTLQSWASHVVDLSLAWLAGSPHPPSMPLFKHPLRPGIEEIVDDEPDDRILIQSPWSRVSHNVSKPFALTGTEDYTDATITVSILPLARVASQEIPPAAEPPTLALLSDCIDAADLSSFCAPIYSFPACYPPNSDAEPDGTVSHRPLPRLSHPLNHASKPKSGSDVVSMLDAFNGMRIVPSDNATKTGRPKATAPLRAARAPMFALMPAAKSAPSTPAVSLAGPSNTLPPSDASSTRRRVAPLPNRVRKPSAPPAKTTLSPIPPPGNRHEPSRAHSPNSSAVATSAGMMSPCKEEPGSPSPIPKLTLVSRPSPVLRSLPPPSTVVSPLASPRRDQTEGISGRPTARAPSGPSTTFRMQPTDVEKPTLALTIPTKPSTAPPRRKLAALPKRRPPVVPVADAHPMDRGHPRTPSSVSSSPRSSVSRTPSLASISSRSPDSPLRELETPPSSPPRYPEQPLYFRGSCDPAATLSPRKVVSASLDFAWRVKEEDLS